VRLGKEGAAMEMVCSIRRFNGGKWLVSYLDHDGHQVAIVPVNFWRRGKPRREIGGPPWPSMSAGLVSYGYRIHLKGSAEPFEFVDAAAAIEALCKLVDCGMLAGLARVERI
jgi:hypothetical protein